MKYRMQIHQLPVPVPPGELDKAALEQVLERFETIYESFYGKGSAYREAGVEIGLFKVNASGKMIEPAIPEYPRQVHEPVPATRKVYWREHGEHVDTPVYSGLDLGPGQVIHGPAVVEYPETTIVVQPCARGSLESSGSFIIELEERG